VEISVEIFVEIFVEIWKLQKGFLTTRGLIGPVDITANLLGSGNQ